MDSVLIQPPEESQSLGAGLFPESNYELILRESVDRFLAGIHRESFDFAGFRSLMSRYLQSSADPPLEVVWLYGAASYQDSIATKDSLDRVRAIRDLFQLLSSCSAASSGAKCIALIAPAIYDLYQCTVEAGLAEKRVMKEIECLAEGILSYISICSGQHAYMDDFSTGLHSCFVDLVRVWTLRRSVSGESLEVFFPLVSGEVREKFGMEGCGVGYLAAVVIAEAFLLRLSLKVKAGGTLGKELQKELGIWAVSSIAVFHNQLFFEILLKLLIDPKVPVATLLNTEDEKLARGVLYDAVTLVDYSFLYPAKEMDHYDRMRNLLVNKLIVTNEAIKIARARGDHGKAISCLNAFSTSSLPCELIKLVRKQIGTLNSEKPNDNSPDGLLKWLVHLEQMGKRIFEDGALRYATKLIFDYSTLATQDSVSADGKKADVDLFFFDGVKSNDGEMESMDAVFSAAAQSMKQFTSHISVKRKEPRDEAGKRFKFIKYDMQNKPDIADGMSGDSEVEDTSSDDDMEESD